MKKAIARITTVFSMMLVSGAVFTYFFLNYGGNNCDQPPFMTCDCFCCNMFGQRGYEACGHYGAILGLSVGFLLSMLVIKFVFRKKKK